MTRQHCWMNASYGLIQEASADAAVVRFKRRCSDDSHTRKGVVSTGHLACVSTAERRDDALMHALKTCDDRTAATLARVSP